MAIQASPNLIEAAVPPFAPIDREPRLDLGHLAFTSYAPKEDVVCIRVFTETKTGNCRGLLLEYGNGSQRCLGECRTGLDTELVFKNPEFLCMGEVYNGDQKAFQVRVYSERPHKPKTGKWKCCNMRGTRGILKYWRKDRSCGMRVIYEKEA
jgi:hypothetical protein